MTKWQFETIEEALSQASLALYAAEKMLEKRSGEKVYETAAANKRERILEKGAAVIGSTGFSLIVGAMGAATNRALVLNFGTEAADAVTAVCFFGGIAVCALVIAIESLPRWLKGKPL